MALGTGDRDCLQSLGSLTSRLRSLSSCGPSAPVTVGRSLLGLPELVSDIKHRALWSFPGESPRACSQGVRPWPRAGRSEGGGFRPFRGPRLEAGGRVEPGAHSWAVWFRPPSRWPDWPALPRSGETGWKHRRPVSSGSSGAGLQRPLGLSPPPGKGVAALGPGPLPHPRKGRV